MFGKKKFCFIVRAYFPAKLSSGAEDALDAALLEKMVPFIAKDKNLDSAVGQARHRTAESKGVPFVIYHIPGKYSLNQLTGFITKGAAECVIVWEDRSQMKIFDLIVDYTLSGRSMNDRLKLKAYTLGDAIVVARSMTENKGGAPCAIQHILGDSSLEALEAMAEGKSACVTHLVWFDEDEALSSLTPDELFEEIDLMFAQTPAGEILQTLLYETKGLDGPGVYLPPLSEDRNLL